VRRFLLVKRSMRAQSCTVQEDWQKYLLAEKRESDLLTTLGFTTIHGGVTESNLFVA